MEYFPLSSFIYVHRSPAIITSILRVPRSDDGCGWPINNPYLSSVPNCFGLLLCSQSRNKEIQHGRRLSPSVIFDPSFSIISPKPVRHRIESAAVCCLQSTFFMRFLCSLCWSYASLALMSTTRIPRMARTANKMESTNEPSPAILSCRRRFISRPSKRCPRQGHRESRTEVLITP